MFGPDGKPLPRCMAWHCNTVIQPPLVFCKSHWSRIPGHIRQAILGERKDILALPLTERGPQPHYTQLLDIAIGKELELRMAEDPAVAEAVKRESEDLAAKQRAARSPILNPESHGHQPEAPPVQTLRVRL